MISPKEQKKVCS